MTDGIDVASYQPTDYSTVGLGFVMVKATEGTGYVNPRHSAQVATGRAHQLVVGHYHFVRPGSMNAQAAYFLQHAAPAAGDVLALDWEDTGVSSADKDVWIQHVQQTAPGHRVILYCNRDFWLDRDTTSFCGDGLWIADPSAAKGQPRIEAPWLFHQYSEAGGLDRNTTRLTAAELRAWAHLEDDMPLTAADCKAVAREVVAELTAPAARDALANAGLYWWERVLDSSIAIPTGPDAPPVARSVAALRPLVAEFRSVGVTDAQLAELARLMVSALVAEAATPKES